MDSYQEINISGMSTHTQDRKEQGLALVGNPGAGKSTILNGIAGAPVFRAGINLGCGMTSVLQRYDCEDGRLSLFDTPGLADIEKRKQAGEEIDKLLQTRMSVRPAFVVTLERGRVRPEDAATIKVVLQAIKSVDVNDKFGVIINQLSPGEMSALREDATSSARVRKCITGSFITSHWIYLPKMEELEDKSDGQLMTQDLNAFFVGLPLTKPLEAVVDKVETRNLEEIIEAQAALIKTMQEAHEEEVMRWKKEFEELDKKAEMRLALIRTRLGTVEAQLKEKQMRPGVVRRAATTAWNILAVGTGLVTSFALGNPAPTIASTLLVKRPQNSRK